MTKCICGDLVENHDSEGCGNPRCFCVLDRADAATSVPLSELTTLRADLAARDAKVARLQTGIKDAIALFGKWDLSREEVLDLLKATLEDAQL